jgi:hypothetical protein
LSDKVAGNLPPEFLDMVSEDLREWGPLRTVDALARSTDGEMRKYSYRLNYASGALLVDLSLGKDDKVEQLRMRPD